ncbi:MAG: serine/threonine protein kinase [Bradymonadia bacterium]|jgi:serine/threonine protein kinase
MTSGASRRAIRGIDTVDNYKIISELGHGGMAIVYRAEDTRLHRQVALKILHEHIASRAENRERFVREARAVARLAHPNIIDIYGFSSPSAPVQYIAAELIEGQTLRSLVESKRYSLPEVGAMVALQVARGLAAAHDESIIHRDVKPENVMISSVGVPKLMDFGLARLLDAKTLTMTGAILGSPAHMSPETIEGAQADKRVDVFAFGTVLYYATVGVLPFDGNSPAAILNVVLNGIYTPAEQANPLISRTLSRIIDRCVERDPDKRYPNAGAVVEALAEWLAGLGLADTDGELKRYFASPETGTRRLKRTIIMALEKRAIEAQSAGQIGAAVAACGRILALEPDHSSAKRLLASIQAGRRKRVVLFSSVAVLLLLGVISFAILGRQPTSAPEQRTVERPVEPTDPTSAIAEARLQFEQAAETASYAATGYFVAEALIDAVWQSAEDFPETPTAIPTERARADGGRSTERDDAVGSRDRDVEQTDPALVASGATRDDPATAGEPGSPGAEIIAPDSADAEAADGGRFDSGELAAAERNLFDVRLRILPLTARVRIDGREVGDAIAAREVRLSDGRHSIELFVSGLSSGRLSETFTVVDGGVNEFAFRVPWPDGFVTVRSNSPGNVAIEGRVYATNERIGVALEGHENTRELIVEVLPPNAPPYRERVTVRTDQTITLTTQF